MKARLAFWMVLPVLVGACVADEAAISAARCDSSEDCRAGQECYRGFCVLVGGADAGDGVDSGLDAGRIDAGRIDAGPSDAGRRDSGPADAGSDGGGGGDAGACSEGATESCYSGPAGTAGTGTCAAGERTCTSGSWGLCVGESVPATEECNGADDDCDGSTDEDFSLDSDPLHCGDCSTACPSGWDCCSGVCRDTVNDKNHCGGCGVRCTPPAKNCCAGSCQVSC